MVFVSWTQLIMIAVVLALLGAVTWVSVRRLWSQVSRRWAIVLAFPGLLMVLSFYALAIHMYLSLEGWPKSIGESGFSPVLLAHANLTLEYFHILLLSAIFGWPMALIVCVIVPRWRRHIPRVTFFEVAFVMSFILISMGPSGFLYWWWD